MPPHAELSARLLDRVPGPVLTGVRRVLPLRTRAALGRGYERAVGVVPLFTGHPFADRRRALWGRFYTRAARFTPIVAVELEDGRRVLVHTGDPYVGRPAFVDIRPYEVEQLERALELADVERGADVLEIGANIGSATLLLCDRVAPRRLVAIEPAPHNYDLLAANVQLNGVGERVHTVRAAVSSADGEAELELSPINAGDHRVRVEGNGDRSDQLDEGSWKTVTVPVRSLDSLVADGVVDADALGLIWLDVQGHEAHVLAGAERLLERRAAPIVMEIWPYGLMRAGTRERLAELVARHFRAFVALPDGTGERPASELDAFSAEVGERPEDVGDVLLLP